MRSPTSLRDGHSRDEKLTQTSLAIGILEAGSRGSVTRYYRSGADVRILAALITELDRLTIPIALSANVANALTMRHAEIAPKLLLKTFPSESSICITAARHLRRCAFAPDVAMGLGIFLEELETAKLQNFAVHAVDTALDPIGAPYSYLAAAWLRTCRALIDAIEHLSTYLRHVIGMQTQMPKLRNVELLRSVLGGHFPYVNADGTLSLPIWAERRKALRLDAQANVRVRRNGKQFGARIRNISAFGLSLSQLDGCSVGEILVVDLTSPRTLIGEIIWVNGSTLGMKLMERLDLSDPIIEGCLE